MDRVASHCDERLLRTGKVSVTASVVRNIGKNPFDPRKRGTSGSEQKVSVLNTLMLRYLRKVHRNCDEFLADMSNDLSYIFVL